MSPGIEVFAPDGIGEVAPGDDLVEIVHRAVLAAAQGPWRAGDIVVVTSKVVSKAERRAVVAADREQAITGETVRTVARRGDTRIVRTRTGLTVAAAGVDASNVAPGQVLLLPVDPDASAVRLRRGLVARAGCHLGVIVSDTAGRSWRVGQTDHAVGAAGIQVLESYAGRVDPYGNTLSVTLTAVADELATAADLVKGKLTGHPVAVVRGLGHLVTDDDGPGAAALVRADREDMFGVGSREAVLAAICRLSGRPDAYEDLVARDGEDLVEQVVMVSGRSGPEAELLRGLVRAAAYPTSA